MRYRFDVVLFVEENESRSNKTKRISIKTKYYLYYNGE